MIREIDVLSTVTERLDSALIPYMLTGSYALAHYARPRMTRDLDLVVELSINEMNDTDPKIDAMVAETYRQMTPDARAEIASDMFDTARAIIDSSLPSNLTRFERRLALIRRLYGDELPERAMLAFAKFEDDDRRSASSMRPATGQ